MLAFTSQPYSEAMYIRPAVSYIPCATASKERTGSIITFAQFKEGNLSSETREDAEIGYKSDDDSIMPPLLSKEEMNVMDSGDESYDEPMSTEMLENICDESQSCPNVNRTEARYKIRNCV